MQKHNTASEACVARQPAAAEVVALAEHVSNRAHQLSERMDIKLRPVMSDLPSSLGDPVRGGDDREYPPLFADLRGQLQSINAALARIEYFIDCTEL